MAIEQSLYRRLSELPALERRPEDSLRCKVCGNTAVPFDIVDFNKCSSGYPFGFADVAVPWHRCAHCGFLFTAFFDDWDDQDFARFVYNDDYIKVDPEYAEIRPRLVAERMAKMLAGYEGARILDYGSGRGVWVQQMRERGFAHVDGYDPFAQPVRPEGRYDLITCQEVIEHSPRPVETLADMAGLLADDGCILLGESLQPNNIFEARCSWWYAAPRNGHCSTFADRTLAHLAEAAGFLLHSGKQPTLHALRRGDRFADLARALSGPRRIFRRIGAPGVPNAPGFNGVEPMHNGPFQWTRDPRIEWRIPAVTADLLHLGIPFVHQFRAQYAAQCTVKIDGRDARVGVRENMIFAEAEGPFTDATVTVELLTPPLKESTGGRRIGLALRVVEDPIPI